MVRQVITRSQRRMEKKQAVILLVLVLAVSLVSFTLGVMVGRSGSRAADIAAAASAPPVRLPVAPAGSPAGEQPAENLTFYDSLPKGEQSPLGSGINLPPAKAAAVAAVESASEVAPPAEKPAVATKAQTPAPVAAVAPSPKTSVDPAPSAGAYLVQAAAFRRSEDARALQAKLEKKGYTAFTQEALLGEKGTWYRVYAGPFGTAEAAETAVARLKAEEKLSALVRKR